MSSARFAPIAIVGRACVLPGALSPAQLWAAVAEGRDLVSTVDEGRWRIAREDVLCEPGRASSDHTWSERGGYVRGFEEVWDPEGFAVGPAVLAGLDPLFHWVLHTAREALADAGDRRRGAVPRPRVSAVFGNLGFPTEHMSRYAEAQWFGDDPGAPDPRNRFMSGGAAALLERALGLAPGVFCLDTACASSLYAIAHACRQLHEGQADLALAGAVNRADDLFLHVGFAALGALSKSGRSRPFHAEADGLLPAEGAGFVALARLDDARRQGMTIHGLIRGVGLSNDGRGRGMLAPSEAGQRRALRRAYEGAGLDPAAVTLLECHATGTTVGDATELRSSAAVFAGAGELAIGSLKSNIGHAITAAGVAGLIKVLEAMRHGQRPPSLHADRQNPVLAQTPFRVIEALEPWPRPGPEAPRIAGISAFGFGGNNAHLIVSEDEPGLAGPPAAAPVDEPVAIVGLGLVLPGAQGARAVEGALLGGASLVHDGEARLDAVELELEGLRFPPKDLRRALAQQLALLTAAREATGADPRLEHGQAGVFVGMEPDPDICRYGARGRLATRLRSTGVEPDPAWLQAARDHISPPLDAAAVLGTMPNIPANRINAQLDLGGPSWTVSAGESSGRLALALARAALRRRELDVAVVGAVDLSCQDIHRGALEALEGEAQVPGDAAVVLVLRRLADARARKDAILGTIEAAGEGGEPELELDRAALRARLGRCWAAGDLRDLAVALLAGRRGLLPDARAWSRGQGMRLDGGHGLEPLALRPMPAPGSGVSLPRAPVHGEVAFVFGGAGAAYPGMGAELFAALPRLHRFVAEASPELAAYFDRPWPAADADTPPLQRLWASSFLAQAHARLSTELLGLRPDAFIGYSSGESNALFAAGAWTDPDAMVAACRDSKIFDEAIGGELRAVARAWGEPRARWETWTVLAPVDALAAALADEPRAHLSIIHHDREGVVAGDPEACARVRARLGGARWLRLHYDLAVHVPELGEIADRWLELHRWPVTAPDDLRIYSAALARAYTPSTNACAQAILAQADRQLDFRRVIEQAWADGVRVFVEHGPRAACSRWIREILGEREAVVVALDRPGQGVEAVLDAVAALKAAGVPCQPQRLFAALAEAERDPARGGGPKLRVLAHPEPIRLRPLAVEQAAAEPSPETAMPTQTMPPAPALPPVDAPAPALDPGPSSQGARAPAVQPHVHVPAPSSNPLAAAVQTQLAQLGHRHREFVAQQLALHQDFLRLREQAMATLVALGTSGHAAEHPDVLPRPHEAHPPTIPPLAPVAPRAEPTPPPAVAPRAEPRAEPPLRPAAVPRAEPSARAPGPPPPLGPAFTREQLEIHAGGRISEIFGPAFTGQDGFTRQVRMPKPPLLLADRVTGLDAEPMSMKLGSIWTETDVCADSWYVHAGRIPAGVMIEAGQADLMLISYLGIDALNRGERVYRLLGCELTYHGGLPRVGDTLRYDIHLDGHAKHGDIRLMFFHYDCHVGERCCLTVRGGQAGFFTDAELTASEGCLWCPEEQDIVEDPRLDPPRLLSEHRSFSAEQVRAFAAGRPWACFGPGGRSPWDRARCHTRTPSVAEGDMLLFDRVARFEPEGGPWGRGYLEATLDIRPDHWFFDGHFLNDPCMPGTLMFEGCFQAMAFYLAALGYTLERDGWCFEPVPEQPYQLSCRGQVRPTSKQLRCEIFVEEILAGPVPTIYADVLGTVDGLKAFHGRRIGLQLVPAWPLDEGHPALEGYAGEPCEVARIGELELGLPAMLACAQGRPTAAFGPIYARFDGPEPVARLPNPPYHFISRVLRVEAELGAMKAGGRVEVEYDIPQDAWYFEQNGCRVMPYAVLLEAALQPCGWLASYMGCALGSSQSLRFRNLDGTGTVHAELFDDAGSLRTKVLNTRLSKTATMIIVGFEVECHLGDCLVYTMDTVFGFFPAAAFEDQAGLPTSPEQRALFEAPSDLCRELDTPLAPGRAQLARPGLLMLDRITAFDPDGGAAGLGFARGEKTVDPGEWFFAAHFFQDPVQPGSLGIEAMIQLLQWAMLELGMDADMQAPRFEALALDAPLRWKYRGQVVPEDGCITTTLEIRARGHDERGAWARGDLGLWIDGKRIYEAFGLGMRIVDDARAQPQPSTRAVGDRGALDLAAVRRFWSQWIGCGPWPGEDLHLGLVDRFVGRLELADADGLARLAGPGRERGALFVANHQVAVESLSFSIIASALLGRPTLALAKAEHAHTWLGRLVELCVAFPGVRDPELLTFFDRADAASAQQVIARLAAAAREGGRSILVHVEGTRSLGCATPVRTMSGVFVDLALELDLPVIPVRFVGGLPVDELPQRLEFPLGMGRQDIWIGAPIAASTLAALPYAERKQQVIAAINGLGPRSVDERQSPGDRQFAARVERWQAERGVSHEHAVLHEVLAELAEPCELTRRLLAARDAAELDGDDSPVGRWLAELARRLLG
jgi:acyl transferase domain-containing protein/3-hydroxymyristoyl/3-hydroxydecanoyl-(acyl carrier protein) dehydratase/1-acyl-sn-glycerol-3-phosphate acyltransferase